MTQKHINKYDGAYRDETLETNTQKKVRGFAISDTGKNWLGFALVILIIFIGMNKSVKISAAADASNYTTVSQYGPLEITWIEKGGKLDSATKNEIASSLYGYTQEYDDSQLNFKVSTEHKDSAKFAYYRDSSGLAVPLRIAISDDGDVLYAEKITSSSTPKSNMRYLSDVISDLEFNKSDDNDD